MEDLLNYLPTIITILGIVLITYVTSLIKKNITKITDNQIIQDIILNTVKYVEQITKDLTIENTQKFNLAKEKVIELLKEKNLTINNKELTVLIESAVNNLN